MIDPPLALLIKNDSFSAHSFQHDTIAYVYVVLLCSFYVSFLYEAERIVYHCIDTEDASKVLNGY